MTTIPCFPETVQGGRKSWEESLCRGDGTSGSGPRWGFPPGRCWGEPHISVSDAGDWKTSLVNSSRLQEEAGGFIGEAGFPSKIIHNLNFLEDEPSCQIGDR